MQQKSTHISPGQQFIIFIGMALASVTLFSVIGFGLLYPLFGINLLKTPDILSELELPHVLKAMKFLQLVNAIGLFIVPSLLFAFLIHKRASSYLKWNNGSNIVLFLIIPLLMLASQPIINLSAEINKNLQLPDFLKSLEIWMQRSENNAEVITKAFLAGTDINTYLFNLFLIAVIPAIGEELMFRGVFQRILNDWTKNIHIAIWISAILFSAMHMQFYGFLPRMFMGALFGYIFYWSGSLWIPILAHFINNALAVSLHYLMNKGLQIDFLEEIGTGNNALFFVACSVVIITLLLLQFYFLRKKESSFSEEEVVIE
ncbi:MAG: lysostaphin resistance A-like protein [Bacteroidia bacterium]